MTLSVIFTTYNSPDWLDKVLWGYRSQIFRDFELIIADDGSTESTAELITRVKKKVDFPVHHVWHEDKGFRKCEILNKAILHASTDYLVFSDGDCIPREDFLQVHATYRRPGYFLSGGAIRLPMGLSKKISPEDIVKQRIFDPAWLSENGLAQTALKRLRFTTRSSSAGFMNRITPTKATWNGGNASAWKKDVLAVNGFDERMRYGAQDREFGERLVNKGILGQQVRYSAVCVHLDHKRGYVNEEDLRRNAEIRQITRKSGVYRTPYGIQKELPPQ
jgi:glycosyltransferase involved in cell wall biosynthesis